MPSEARIDNDRQNGAQASGPRRGALIVNADDWGRDRETTKRILECLQCGTISSVSAMVFMKDSAHAAAIAREHAIDAGLHLNFTTPFSRCPALLAGHQERIGRRLLRHRLARILFDPWLMSSFEYVIAAQLEAFSDLYGALPGRIDGHHHMHLCANVLCAKLLPRGAVVRRTFSIGPGDKGAAKRLYHATVDGMLARRHVLTDYFFALAPVEPRERLRKIFSLAQRFAVEVEAHPVNTDEYQFLSSGELFRLTAGRTVASGFLAHGEL